MSNKTIRKNIGINNIPVSKKLINNLEPGEYLFELEDENSLTPFSLIGSTNDYVAIRYHGCTENNYIKKSYFDTLKIYKNEFIDKEF